MIQTDEDQGIAVVLGLINLLLPELVVVNLLDVDGHVTQLQAVLVAKFRCDGGVRYITVIKQDQGSFGIWYQLPHLVDITLHQGAFEYTSQILHAIKSTASGIAIHP